jgi:hypothetical protein
MAQKENVIVQHAKIAQKDCPKIAQKLPKNCPKIAQKLPKNCPKRKCNSSACENSHNPVALEGTRAEGEGEASYLDAK